MKFKFLPFVIIFFLIMGSIFGFLFMGEMIHSECPLFQMLGGSCSPDTNAIVLLSHHLAGLKILSSSFIIVNLGSLLAFLFSFALLSFSLLSLSEKAYFNFRPDRYIKFNPIKDLISWLSLLNKGDHLLFLPA